MEDTQSVSSSTWVITPRHSILSRCSLTLGHKEMGHFLGAYITECTSCHSWILYLPGNLPIPMNQSRNSFIKSSVDLMDLTAAGTVAGLTFVAVVEAGAGLWGFVLGCMTVTAQFIFMIASLSYDGRPRMAGPGVSAMYQYELILWGQMPVPPGHQTMGPWSAPYRGI